MTIPDSVTNIDACAFSECSNLTSVTIPHGVTSIGKKAFDDCRSLTAVTIPEGVTSIGEGAFKSCVNLTNIILPKTVTNIGEGAFCTALAKMQLPLAALQMDLFSNGFSIKNVVIADVWLPDGGSKRVVAAFRSGGYEKKQILKKPCLAPLSWEDIPHYDRLVTSGSYDGFSLNQTERMQAALLRLGDTEFPVADDARSDMIKLIETKVAKIIALADEDNAPSYIQTLLEVGAINGTNMAKVKKQISACSSPEVKAMANKLAPTQTAKVTEAAKPARAAERLVRECLKAEGLTEKQSADKLKEYYAVTRSQLPTVLCKDGSEAAPCVLVWLLIAHETVRESKRNPDKITELYFSLKTQRQILDYWYYEPPVDITTTYPSPGIRPEAAEIVAELDQSSLQNALLKLADYNFGTTGPGRSKKMYLTFPICRYADEKLMEDLCQRALGWRTVTSGKDTPPLLNFRIASAYSTTRAALLFADKNGDLKPYAKIRGVKESVLKNQALPEIEWD